jgi:hypothetical protein
MSTVAWYGSGHLSLAGYLVVKHWETYRAHLIDVFLHQDTETGELLRRNDELERYIASDLEPWVALRRRELATLRSRLGSAAPQAAGEAASPETVAHIRVETALRAASADVTALRTSISWRITGPLRDAYGWWLRRRATKG